LKAARLDATAASAAWKRAASSSAGMSASASGCSSCPHAHASRATAIKSLGVGGGGGKDEISAGRCAGKLSAERARDKSVDAAGKVSAGGIDAAAAGAAVKPSATFTPFAPGAIPSNRHAACATAMTVACGAIACGATFSNPNSSDKAPRSALTRWTSARARSVKRWCKHVSDMISNSRETWSVKIPCFHIYAQHDQHILNARRRLNLVFLWWM
jgi:hypothetical protein